MSDRRVDARSTVAPTWRLIDAWGPAARELDVEVEGPVRRRLPSGDEFEAPLRFPDFADLHGLVVVSDPEVATSLRGLLAGSGYTVGELPVPEPGRRHTGFELAQFLQGTGWSGSEKGRPEWM